MHFLLGRQATTPTAPAANVALTDAMMHVPMTTIIFVDASLDQAHSPLVA